MSAHHFEKQVSVGDILGDRYRIEKKISKKDKCAYVVADTKNNDEIKSVKMINFSSADRNQMREILREEKILSRLNSPYVVKYHESFINDNNIYIVTEYCEGGDLEKRLKAMKKEGHRLPEDKIFKWFIQLVSAIHYIHHFSPSEKVLHRNLKPSNIFIKDENLKIGDFGISRILDQNEDASTFIGTPYYMSPEVVKNERYGSKSDIWAIGCILYEMATFQRPFVADTVYGIFKAIVHEPTPSITHLYSRSLNDLVQKTLEKDHTLRPSASQLLMEDAVASFIKESFLSTIKAANNPETMVRLANSLSFISEDMENDLTEYEEKSTIKHYS